MEANFWKVPIFFFVSFCIFVFIILVVQAFMLFKKLMPKSNRRLRDGVVLLHQMPPNNRVLNASSPCLKLETYLRMCNIPYESEYSFKMSSKGKVPWIEYNGRSVADSNFIVRFLNEEFKVDPDTHLSVVEKAIAHTMIVTLEENTYWTLMYHIVEVDPADTKSMSPLLSVTPYPLKYVVSWMFYRVLKNYLWSHGIGRHTREEIYSIAENDLRAASELLGNKRYTMGSKPCLLDAVLFGLVSVLIWNVPTSRQANLIRSELKNLERHCYNIKEEYFPDWDQLILKHKIS